MYLHYDYLPFASASLWITIIYISFVVLRYCAEHSIPKKSRTPGVKKTKSFHLSTNKNKKKLQHSHSQSIRTRSISSNRSVSFSPILDRSCQISKSFTNKESEKEDDDLKMDKQHSMTKIKIKNSPNLDIDTGFTRLKYIDATTEYIDENEPESTYRDNYLLIESNNRVMMNDENIDHLLSEVGVIIKNNYNNKQHICAVYDIRSYLLPRFSEANSRIKQLLQFCGSLVIKDENGDDFSLVDRTVHTVAIIIPSGFAAKLLKKLVDFFLWAAKPPMEPKVFEGDMEAAEKFVKQRRLAYLAGQLNLVPPSSELKNHNHRKEGGAKNRNQSRREENNHNNNHNNDDDSRVTNKSFQSIVMKQYQNEQHHLQHQQQYCHHHCRSFSWFQILFSRRQRISVRKGKSPSEQNVFN